MVPCPKCGNINPLGTRYCRACGEKIEVTFGMIQASVGATQVQNRDTVILGWGRSAIALSVFLLICAVVLRTVLVPALPRADLPPVPTGDVFPSTTESKPGANGTTTTAAVVVGAAETTSRLVWRRINGEYILRDLRLNYPRLHARLDTLAATQMDDGSFPGEDKLAATALACLALQSFPSDRTLAAAQRARAVLTKALPDLQFKPALARTLTIAALADAEELTAAQLAPMRTYLIDGKAAVWQALAVAALPSALRPKEKDLVLLRTALPGNERWTLLIALLGGNVPADVRPSLFSVDSAAGLKLGEERLVWAFSAWQFHPSPDALLETLRAWSSSDTAAPVDPEVSQKCGPTASSSVAILATTTPLRVLPLALFPRTAPPSP